MKKMAADANENGKYVAYVRDFFAGNEYYMFRLQPLQRCAPGGRSAFIGR